MKPSREPSADAIALLTWAGIPWRRGPIPTGLSMLEHDLLRRGGWHSPRLPEAALRGATETPLNWSRPLDETERGRRFVHLIDKSSAYLSVCGGLELGAAHPQRHDRPAFDARMPGYWRIVADSAPWPLDRLPDPLGRDRRLRAVDERWVTTPTLELVRELDVDCEIREAWLWPVHKQLLRPFYDRIRRARWLLERVARAGSLRQVLAASEPRVGALDSLKSIYAALLGGGLASTKDRRREPHPPWYRPDWRHAVIAKSRANMLRNLLQWSAFRISIGAVLNDGAYIVSDRAEPPVSAGYRLKGTWPLESMVNARSGRIVPSLAWGEDDDE